MRVILTRGWCRLDNAISEMELDNPTPESVEKAITKMYGDYIGTPYSGCFFGWEKYHDFAIISFGPTEIYGAIPNCPEELFPKMDKYILVREKELKDMQDSFAKVKEIADEMHRFGSRHWMHYEGQTTRDFADRIDDTIKEFVKGDAECQEQ